MRRTNYRPHRQDMRQRQDQDWDEQIPQGVKYAAAGFVLVATLVVVALITRAKS